MKRFLFLQLLMPKKCNDLGGIRIGIAIQL
jgi:hypothetical protein